MPYSSNSGKRFIDRVVQRLDDKFFVHHRVLDLGAGSGTYSDRYTKLLPRSKFTWDAVEIWEPYVEKFNLNSKYDNIALQDAVEYVNSTLKMYDICFIGDLVEHMTKEKAQELVSAAMKISQLVIISIPIIHYPQGEYEGNPYEAHVKDDWSTTEVLQSFKVAEYAVENEIGVFVILQSGVLEHQFYRDYLTPKIGAYAICKNEIKFIDRFFNSIKTADQVVVCDTGSTDGTYERLLEHASTHPNMIVRKIFISPFRFDDARNCALSLLDPNLDLCVSIDADEFMISGDKDDHELVDWRDILASEVILDLRKNGVVTDRCNHRFKTYWNWDKPEQPPNYSEHWHERIHARHNYLWKLPVHEVLVKQGEPEKVKWLGGFFMYQHPDTIKSRSSYLPMLEISVREDPKRWKTWSFYAGDLIASGRHQEGIEAIKKAKTLPDADVAYLCNQLSRSYQTIGDRDNAEREMMNACMINPRVREYKVYLAEIYKAHGKLKEAKSALEMAATITERTNGYEFNPQCWGENFERMLTA